MKLAVWKYFSVIMALVLVLGTGVTVLGPTPTAAATTPPHQSPHATDNVTDRHSPHLTGASENHTHHFAGFSRYSVPVHGYTAGNTWYVNGATGSDTTGAGSQANPWKTIQHAIDAAGSGDTVNIAAAYASGDFYDEQLTISKSISLVGEAEVGYFGGTHVEQSGLLIVNITDPGLDVRLSNLSIFSYNWTGQCIRASGDTVTLNNVDFFGDRRIGGSGGGIYADNCTLTLSGCYIDGDAGNNGGGIYADNCTLTLNGCMGQGEAGSGGVIYAADSTVSAADCTFWYFDGSAGGAMYVEASTLNAQRCSFYGDWDDFAGDGGGIYTDAEEGDCSVNLGNCTFSGIIIDSGNGACLYVSSDIGHAAVSLTSCTLFANSAEGYGGGLYQEGANSTTTIRNCIFDNEADSDGNNIYVDSGTVDSDYNLFSDTPCITTGPQDRTNELSRCYDMADNGGLTPTCAIDSTSPARGAGSTALATDQRGVTRATPTDIGAYQWVGPTYANDVTGNDANSGLDAAHPKKHIYAAANLAGPGSTAYIAAGTYPGEYHLDIFELDYYNVDIYKPLTLSGAGAASTIVDDSAAHMGDDDTIIDVYDCYYYDSAADEEVYGPISISGLTLKNAQGEGCYGGGLYIENGGVTTVQNCIMEDNYAENGGGGINIDYAGTVAVLNCTISNNSAWEYGGGIYAYGADNATISGCMINGNSTDYYGGGIYFGDCYIFSLAGSTVNRNTADSDGGGIYGNYFYGYYYDEGEDQYYDTRISTCTIDGNTSSSSGGGVYLYQIDYNDYTGTIEACTLSNNQADGNGGGINNCLDSRVQLINCTLYGNSITAEGGGEGGGVYNEGHAEMLNCTIAANNAGSSGEGGGWYEQGGPTGIFKNTIMAGNLAGAGVNNDIAGGGNVVSQGHNICTTDASRDYFDDPTDMVSSNPNLGALQNNGGPTYTCAIGGDSLAFNTAADGPSTDQRRTGFPRPALGGYDIGAFELQSLLPGPTVTSCNPASGARGTTVTVTITGSNFTSASAVVFTDNITDLTGPFTVISPTQISITLTIPAGAGLGAYDVLVTTPDGMGVGTGKFTVVQAGSAPTISSVSPDSGMWGQTLTVTITGTNFTGATAVSFGPDITVTFTVVSSTQINATVTIAPGAALGTRNISVTTPQGTGTNSFTVKPNPSLTGTQSHGGSSGSSGGSSGQGNQGMTPVSMPNIVVQSATISNARVAPGETVTITANLANKGTINGTSAVKVYVNGQEEAVQGVTVNGGSNRPISFTLSRNEPGTYTVYVGGTQAGSFTVEQVVDPNIILITSAALVLSGLVLGVIYIRRRQNYY